MQKRILMRFREFQNRWQNGFLTTTAHFQIRLFFRSAIGEEKKRQLFKQAELSLL